MQNVAYRRQVSRNRVICRPLRSFSTLVQEITLAYELEIVVHAPAYQVGLCLIEQHEFPRSILSISPDLASCIISPGEDRVVADVPTSAPKMYIQTERAAELLVRVRRHRRQSAR
jgi:hypothetical protein